MPGTASYSPSETQLTVSVANYPHYSVKIAAEPDLTVRIYEYQDVYAPPGRLPPIKCVTDYAVSRTIMRANSEPFDAMLQGGWMESRTTIVELKENDWIMSLAMEIWFRAFHGVPMTEECYKADVAVVWSLVRAGNMWKLKREGLIKWFSDWFKECWERNKGKDLGKSMGKSMGGMGGRSAKLAQVILYPCWAFDHAPGFAAATKWLVYHSASHITEFNPTKHRDLHLPKRIIQQLNAARGRLKAVMHDILWTPIERPLKYATCDCKEVTLFLYQKALLDVSVWPLERTFSHTSITGLLGRLEAFEYKSEHKPCSSCEIRCEEVVKNTIREVSGYFDGLCLVCMALTEPGAPHDADWYYWNHDKIKDWDRGCRGRGVKHGQPTWFYSYMSATYHKDARENWYRLRRFNHEPNVFGTDIFDDDFSATGFSAPDFAATSFYG
ncbi:hypothetical protein DIS24_g11022 [Lasiodiplodia hormozganensis]|uniref:BTB domain-containing protein n=1 Tax=Lasiodiplodia hormozganensis TaxID=869390 RepID=A0AA39X2L0_9PEZI|nr:hypothetical protein DIS24_g11022 [Lasiodiplodia hormozganensis]